MECTCVHLGSVMTIDELNVFAKYVLGWNQHCMTSKVTMDDRKYVLGYNFLTITSNFNQISCE